MIIDSYGRVSFTEREICNYLYLNPTADLSNVYLNDPELHNNAVTANSSSLSKLNSLPPINMSVEEWHALNQTRLFMPKEYYEFDVVKYILDQCNENEVELQRCGEELLEYANRNLLDYLKFMKYLVDTMIDNNIIWGIGRGSSVASFVLFKLGVHRINSIQYDLDYKEFFH